VGTPGLDGLMPSLGAGLGDAEPTVAGEALVAEEPAQAQNDTPPEALMPANPETEIATSGDEPSSVIELAGRTMKPEAAETTAVTRGANGLVTVRPKPEKRKNAKERAKDKVTKDRTTPDTTAKAKSRVETKAQTKKAKKTNSAARKTA
jgi:hypothetical protein